MIEMKGKRKILVIDDEKDFCALVKRTLEKESSAEVSFACSGDDGIQLAKKWKPHLIVLDLIMPGMNGFEVLKKLKEDECTLKIPVIVLTALCDEETERKTAELHDEIFLAKPIHAGELKAKIDEVFVRGVF